MATFKLVKTMTRKLTDDEEDQVRAYLQAYSGTDLIGDTAKHFENLLNTPVTQTCVMRIALGMVKSDAN